MFILGCGINTNFFQITKSDMMRDSPASKILERNIVSEILLILGAVNTSVLNEKNGLRQLFMVDETYLPWGLSQLEFVLG